MSQADRLAFAILRIVSFRLGAHFAVAWLAVGGLLPSQPSAAQEPNGSGAEAPAAASKRPGLFRVGTLYLTPYVHLGTLGVDTNVFYSATDRQSDFLASGGPGLEVVRPIGKESQVRLDGAVDYLWYARTESQRRLNGHGSALLDLHGVKSRLSVEETYATSYSRPSYEVNERVQQETEGTRALLTRRLGERVQIAAQGSRARTTTDSTRYLGTDLGRTLTEDRYAAGGEVRVALSIKTQLVAGSELGWHSFPRDPARDGRTALAYGGFRTDSTALISGRALGGVRALRLDVGSERQIAYFDVEATWSHSPKTKVGVRGRRDLDYTAFATTGPTPTNVQEVGELYFDKMLSRVIYLRLFGRVGQLTSDGSLILTTPDEGLVVAARSDRIREAGVELGYQFRDHFRVGASATYSRRRSTIETFGVNGLLAGLTIQYNPPQPSFR